MREGDIRVTVVNESEDIAELISDLLADGSRYEHRRLLNHPSVEEIADSEPDLIVLGLRASGRTPGWQVLDGIRAESRLSTVPVILCTGDLHGLRERFSDGHPDSRTHVLEKPFDLDTFLGTVDLALEGSWRADHAGAEMAEGPV